jgi:23S rRNA U2552 (ribose-2'-O)-methylase RlmE/FtsJ
MQVDESITPKNTLNEDEGYDIYDITQSFLMFAKDYNSFEEALNHMGEFVAVNYGGNNVENFRNIIRSGYKTLVDEYLDSLRDGLEKRVLLVSK